MAAEELQEVDIEKELAKSDSEDVPTLTIQTEPLTQADVDINVEADVDLEKDATGLSQKELLASLIEGSPDENKSPLEEGEVVEKQESVSLEVGEIPEEELNQASQLSKSPLEEGEVDETDLNKTD